MDKISSDLRSSDLKGADTDKPGAFVSDVINAFGASLIEDHPAALSYSGHRRQSAASNIDAFTGGQKVFSIPEWLEDMDLWDVVKERPPSLPGADPDEILRFARGMEGGPLYYSPNIQNTDSLALRLAYMRSPLTLEDMDSLLLSVIPRRAIPETRIEVPLEQHSSMTKAQRVILAWNQMTAEQGLWKYELIVIGLVDNGSREDRLPALQHWRMLQYLCAAVLWAWDRHNEANISARFYSLLADEVLKQYSTSHYQTLTFPRELNLDAAVGREDLLRHYKKTGNAFELNREPISLALLSEQLYEIIRTGGSKLIRCHHCSRFAESIRRREFCSDYCRSAHFAEQSGKKKKP